MGDRTYVLDGRTGLRHEDAWNDFAALWVDLHYRDCQARTACEGISGPEIPFIPELLDAAEKGFPGDFMGSAHMVCQNRRVFSTNRGYLGLGPKILQEGDMVFILPESVPFVLRPQGNHYLLVGDCYIDGAMYGEIMEPTNIQSIEIH